MMNRVLLIYCFGDRIFMKTRFYKLFALLSVVLIVITAISSEAQNKKPFTFDDVMHFKSLRGAVISNNGNWAAYYEVPDRGNPEGVVVSTEKDATTKEVITFRIERGTRPVFTNNSKYAVFTVVPDAIKMENADKDKPKNSISIVSLPSGEITEIEEVKNFKISENGTWMAYEIFTDEKSKGIVGGKMILRRMDNGSELSFDHVNSFEFDSTSRYIAYSIAEPDAKKNGVFVIDLSTGAFPMKIEQEKDMLYSSLTWNEQNQNLAYVVGKKDGESVSDSCSLKIWSRGIGDEEIVAIDNYPENWRIPFDNQLNWTEDGERLFFGFKPVADTAESKPEIKFSDSTYFNLDTILTQKDVDIWHWNDPLIKPNRKKWWDRNKGRIFKAVYFSETKNWTMLADENLPNVQFVDNNKYTIGTDDTPYLREITWDGWYQDLYLVDLISGDKKLIKERIYDRYEISPKGDYVVYFYDKHWYLYDTRGDTTVNLTNRTNAKFYDEDWDLPAEPKSYGTGGWLENDQAVILYDKYDIWKFYTSGGYGYLNQTAADGRVENISFRIYNLDKDKKYIGAEDAQLISGFDNKLKNLAIYRLDMSILGAYTLMRDPNKRFTIVAKAKESNKLIYTRESYEEFPDLWAADTAFVFSNKISDVNPQMEDYEWGTTELVSWVSAVGDSLQGYLIKPYGYDSNKSYPLLVYFYEKFSDLKNRFEQPGIHHRPCFPVYNSSGYVIFLPDIVYRDGYPGQSAIDCIMPGVKMLVDKGIADKEKLAIWGHSWSGYQAAYMVTQLDDFKAAVAGAPVGNMTSAYSGIRHGTGLARQFQYEKYQSRIGGTIWDSLDNYINNSPVFFAEDMNTPLLIMHGDVDDAVPWEQSIEIYLAMRRLDKNCIFLQYRNEPHWPGRYPNKVDYAVKMKEFFDYYILGIPMPEWIKSGKEYRGR
jgi:hypothetical protein